MALGARIDITGGFVHVAASGSPKAGLRLGRAGAPAGTMVLADGTGAGQANWVYTRDISLATLTFLDIDLKGGGGELDALGVAMAATAVKVVLLEVTSPAAGVSLRLGPQNRTNAAQLWFQAATANFYDEVPDTLYAKDERAGWALDATHKVLSIYNPSAVTVAAKLWAFGTK